MDPDPGHLGTDPGPGSWKMIGSDPDQQHWIQAHLLMFITQPHSPS
jgi:hypothetical protein